MNIRYATRDDFENILQIGSDIFDHLENKAHFNWPRDVLLKELEQVQILLAEDDNMKIIGFIAYRDLIDLYEISVLATALGLQKKGYQFELLSYLQVVAARRQRSIILEVHQQNLKAYSLYCKTGFKLLNTRKSYYSDGGAALVMGWNVNKAGC